MAATGNNATTSTGESNGNVPQWKIDLIQRRRQQNKSVTGNGGIVKLYSSINVASSSSTIVSSRTDPLTSKTGTIAEDERCSNVNGGTGNALVSSTSFFLKSPPCGATVNATGTIGSGTVASPVACNMRLEADLSFCSDSEDLANSSGLNKSSFDTDKKSEHGDGSETEESGRNTGNDTTSTRFEENRRSGIYRTGKLERDSYSRSSNRNEKIEREMAKNEATASNEDGESDSSEELQYGPGIVNRLKSKYLNLTLREMNDRNRVSVQRFRRAASLEDLLDCDDEPADRNSRKYAKRIAAGGQSVKTDRYRNVSRGNESMKRARSVETLMRYNGAEEAVSTHAVVSRTPSSNGVVKQEPVNNRIILVDRTTVKIENRLGESDRPKPVNKPKRIKPLLAETERPPPDLVKTTMRIFEGSAKKVKPKGEVAAKVATFKTINDTFKAQTQKKVAPKPPIQPKPFVNGNSRQLGSPKKIILPQKPTAELIEKEEDYHIDGVITETIVQSVSSVVSKFQRIEKSHSPSPSPEPSSFKLKFSPIPSPEPQSSKLKSSLEINAKSPPVTPILSPRISSPRVQSPSSPMKDRSRQVSSPVHGKPPPSPSRESFKQPAPQPPPRPQVDESPGNNVDRHPRQQIPTERIQSPLEREKLDGNRSDGADCAEQDQEMEDEERPEEAEKEEEEEVVDAPKTISKTALENIARTGVTMQFSFGDKPISNKSYLPGLKQNGQKPVDEISVEFKGKSFLPGASGNVLTDSEETVSRLQERLEPDKCDRKIEDFKIETETKPKVGVENKPIGAICSLGLIKSSTTTSYPQGNESKTIRCQKVEPPPQKQIGIIRPLVSTKTQHPQQNLSNRELEKNLINRVKSIEQPTKVVVSLKSAEEIQPTKKSNSGGGGGGGGGLWEAKPWNQQNNTMVFNFSNRKDVPDYIENDGLIIRKKREKPKVGDGGIIVLDATLDASTTDDAEWELSGGPPSPCDVSFFNDNVLINGRSNLSKTPRNHKHRIQFDDTATRTFEYPSEASMLEGEGSSVDGETSSSVEQSPLITNKTSSSNSTTGMPSLLGGSGGLASYTPSKVDLSSEGFELGVTRTLSSTPTTSTSTSNATSHRETTKSTEEEDMENVDYLKPTQDGGAWGSETTGDLLY